MPPQQHPIELGPETPMIEFGAEPAQDRPARRWNASGFARALAGDRRAVPLAAGLGAVAAFLSLVSEWQVTTVDAGVYGGGAAGDRAIPTDLADLGAVGAGYLAGLFLLVTAVVLSTVGPVAGRRYTRLAGLSVGGTLFALLLAVASSLAQQSRVISRLYTLDLDSDQFRLSYGRGLWCALFGVAAALVALYLAGRQTPAVEPADDEDVPEEPPAVWSWRRPPAGDEDDATPDEPFDLTVAPAKPFAALIDDRDQPNGSGRPGISG